MRLLENKYIDLSDEEMVELFPKQNAAGEDFYVVNGHQKYDAIYGGIAEKYRSLTIDESVDYCMRSV